MIWYRAGSFYESPGKTGLAHLVEHMMFRGTSARPTGAIDAETGRLGGFNNAVTTHDHAVYYFVVPREHWRTPLEIEADRMVNCLFEPGEFETERRIAVEERKSDRDDPETILDEEVDRLAFASHPYRNPVAGRIGDLEKLSVSDAVGYYLERYTPGNAVLVVVGDIPAEEVRGAVEELFAGHSRRGPAPPRPARAREERGRRHSVVSGFTTSAEVAIAHLIPPVTDPDTAALEVLGAALASGRSSRLYAGLVRGRRLSNDVTGFKFALRDPGLFYISGRLLPGIRPETLEAAVDEILSQMATGGMDEPELEKAKAQAELGFRQASETTLGLAGILGLWESLGGWELAWSLERRVREVTPSEVARALGTYFDRGSRVSVWLVPEQ